MQLIPSLECFDSRSYTWYKRGRIRGTPNYALEPDYVHLGACIPVGWFAFLRSLYLRRCPLFPNVTRTVSSRSGDKRSGAGAGVGLFFPLNRSSKRTRNSLVCLLIRLGSQLAPSHTYTRSRSRSPAHKECCLSDSWRSLRLLGLGSPSLPFFREW